MSNTISGGFPWEIVTNVSGNDDDVPAGEEIVIGEDQVTPNGFAGTTGTATTTNLTTGAVVTFAEPFVGEPNPDQFALRIPYNSALTGAYTLTFTNPDAASPLVETTPAATGATPPPFASNVVVSGGGATPTISWTYPTGSADLVAFQIFDLSTLNAAGQPEFILQDDFTGTTGLDTIQAGLINPNDKYFIKLLAVKLRDPNGPADNENSLADSETYFDYSPLVAGAPAVSLPYVDPATGAYQYSIASVTAGQEVFIDPAIAIGYTYKIGAGNPNFASVQLPKIQTGHYTLTYTVGGKTQTVSVAPGAVYSFPVGGVASFTVTGVDKSLALDPTNSNAFITGLTFAGNGSFTGTQMPLLPPSLAALAQTNARGQDVLGAITPTLAGDTYTVISNAKGGVVSIVNDQVIYTPRFSLFGLNLFGTDSFTYTATDENGFTITGTAVIGGIGLHNVTGAAAGNTTVILGGGINTVALKGTNNAVSLGAGDNTVTGGVGDATVTTGIGINSITLGGTGNTVTTGSGEAAISTAAGGSTITVGGGQATITLGSVASTVGLNGGNDTVTGGTGDTFNLTGLGGNLSLTGNDEMVFLGAGRDAIAYSGQELFVDLPTTSKGLAALGADRITETGASAGSVIDLINLPSGIKSISDGHGGSLYSLGHGASIDVINFATVLANGLPTTYLPIT